jgi:hypothetical protein
MSIELVMPVDASQTWAEHFTSHSWNTPQNQIDAGYPIYCQPIPASGSAEWTHDYGAVIQSALVSVTMLVSGPQPSVQISYKETIGGSWINAVAGVNAKCSSFRYLRVALTATALCRITSVSVSLGLSGVEDSGFATSVSTDATGTLVSFNKAFADIIAITVTPIGTVNASLVVNFVDTPYPTDFRVLAFEAGVRATRDFFWSAKGVY